MPPRARPEIVRRPRLVRLLDGDAGPALTLVTAPVGYGKTVLLQSWGLEHTGAAVTWVTLDAADNDPVRLWTYLASAIDRVREGLGRGALTRLRVPGAPIEAVVGELLTGVATYG